MSVTVVLHELTRTGAPRIGGLIAIALKKERPVRVVSLDGGPLKSWLEERLGANNVSVEGFEGKRFEIPFVERVRRAERVLDSHPGDIVYVNSLAASEYVVAAKRLGRRAVLHVHEKAAGMMSLLLHQLAKIEVLSLCDGVVLDAGDLRHDLVEVFGFVPEACLDFGVVIDFEEMTRIAGDGSAEALSAAGEPLRWGERLAIGMCGHASPRKGCDIFFETAAATPQHDFVWVGNWGPPDTPENIVYERFVEERLPNLFVSGLVANPYQYISRFDLFFLSSREDPNPVVVGEALALRVPTLVFSCTTGVTDFLGRSAILCHGATNTADAVRILNALDPEEVRSEEFRRLSDRFRARFDIREKIGGLSSFLASL
jgi:glycosyltransferase involved in cell wall biosynthesis